MYIHFFHYVLGGR